MAQADIGAGLSGLPYVDPATSLTNGLSSLPNAGAATAPSSPLLSAPTVPSYDTTPVPSSQDFIKDVTQSPEYKQAMQNIDLWAKQQQDNAAFEAEWNKKFYEQNRSQIAGSGGSYGAGLAEAAAIDQLQKEKAAHDLANQQEYTREALGSRGLGSSGQVGVDQGELKYNYDTLIKQIDLAAQARQAQAAQAGANARKGISNQLADLDLRYQYALAKQGNYDTQLAGDIAQKKGAALLQVADQLRPYYFDASTGVYRGAGGEVLTPQQAQATVAQQPSFVPSSSSAADNLYAISNAKSNEF